MRTLAVIITAAVLLLGCAERGMEVYRPPALSDGALSDGFGPDECSDVFPARGWQFVHSIDFVMDNGYGTTVVGVISLEQSHIDCALLSLEGFTLFEALFSQETGLRVHRAVPPFDEALFAEGLIGDIRTIFLRPSGRLHTGLTRDKTRVCRFTAGARPVEDIILTDDGCLQIRSYAQDGRLRRLIEGEDCRDTAAGLIPFSLQLRAYGASAYTLNMKLLRAEPLL